MAYAARKYVERNRATITTTATTAATTATIPAHCSDATVRCSGPEENFHSSGLEVPSFSGPWLLGSHWPHGDHGRSSDPCRLA